MANESKEFEERAKLSSSAHNFPIVGIGASAGGLDAFKKMLKAIPLDSNMAYVVVQHLNADHESNLTEILSRVTNIPIEEVTDEVKIFPNHIYVMPSGKVLTSVDGVLKLTPRDSVKTNLVIDIFFTSIAVVWESMAVGVVLSGTGSDGTVGLKLIKEHGGITIVQDESAAYGGMPQSAVDAHVVDFVLSAEKIPAQLLKINNTYASAHAIGEDKPLPKSDEIVFKQMLQILYQRSGVDFAHYKQTTVHRRIGRRMALHKRGDLADYLKFLRSDKAEQDTLFQDMLIHVTSFFRDPKTFETLSEKVIPALIQNKPDQDVFRFWIAGCATGEEAYSFAICLHEYLEKNLSGKKIQIFASDISAIAIEKARAGIYSITDVQTISEERLNNYFTKTGGNYRVNKDIRDLCVFANHNFLKDPPFAKMDLISCRNVFIYLDTFLQKKALTTFHYALKENGTLLLGKSETVSAASELFTSFDGKHKIYSRKAGIGRFMQVTSGRREETLATQNTKAKKESSQTDFRNSANAILISKSPAAVVVNAEMDIVHIHGDIEPFLKHSPGKPSLNLLKMASSGLAFELRNAIHKAKNSENPIIKQEIPGDANSNQALVTIEVFPLIDTVEPHYLIMFTKIYLPDADEKDKSSSEGIQVKNNGALVQIEQLKKELAHTREDMFSITEEMESANEELQSANEELLSGNEEMQSLNEELQSSKEELQSTNEELISLNQELIEKQEQYNAAINYSEAIVRTIKEPLLVLDKGLYIKSANDSFYNKINTTNTEVEGKLFYEIQDGRWNTHELRNLLENILPQKSVMEDFEMIIDERIILLSAREITSVENAEQLILLSIVDVTDTRLAKKLQISESRLREFIMQAPAMLALLKEPEHRFELISPLFSQFLGNREMVGKKLFEAIPEFKGQGIIELIDTVYKTGATFSSNEMPVMVENGNEPEQFYLNFTFQAYKNEEGKTEGILVFCYDVTAQVTVLKIIEESETSMRQMASHLKLATDSANVGTWSLDLQTYKVEWSAMHNKMWGYDEHRTEITYEDWHKHILPEDIELAFKRIEDARVNNTVYDVEYRISRADDEAVRYIRSFGKYYYNDKGEAETLTGISIDITEQKESELKLKASEEKYHSLFETMDQGFSIIEMIFDSDNKPVDCVYIETNPVFEKLTGLKNVTGKTAKELIPNIEEHWFQIYGKVALTGEPNRFIEGSETLDRWFETYTFRLGDQGSKKVAVLFTDITERKQNEETLRYRKALLEAHNEANRDGLLLVDAKGKIISYNQGFIDVWRMPKKIVDALDDDLALEFAMTQLVNPQQFVDKVKWLYEHPSETSIDELEYLDGRIIERHGYSVLGEDGTYYAWSWTFRDITEQRQADQALIESEERFRIMADAAPNIVWALNPDSSVKYVNKFALEFFGVNLDKFAADNWMPYVHSEDLELTIQIVTDAIQNRRLYSIEQRLLRHDGEYRWLFTQGAPSYYPNGELYGYVGSCVDITDLKKVNAQLILINNDLDNFVYTASHDLKAPIFNIEGLMNALVEYMPADLLESETVEHIIKLVQTSIDRFKRTVTDLTDVAKIQREMGDDVAYIPLADVIREVKLDFKTVIEASDAQIEIVLDPDAIIRYSEKNIRSIVYNLLSNALKYKSPERKPEIKITTGTSATHVVLEVKDNGLGFDLKDERKMFSMFRRLHDHVEGTGIGLFIVKRMVENAGGKIEVESEVGKGSTFKVYFHTTVHLINSMEGVK